MQESPQARGGSYEGYMNGSSAHIQMSGAGYDNPQMQEARYAPSENFQASSSSGFSNINSGAGPKPAIINNYSNSYRKGSTPHRIKAAGLLQHII
jgi:hypothetical protein